MNDSKEKNNRVVGKVIAVIVAFAVMLATSFVVANFVHNRDNSQTVSKVQNGLSAYELAVEQGYDGSVQDWLDSLRVSRLTILQWKTAIREQKRIGLRHLNLAQNRKHRK